MRGYNARLYNKINCYYIMAGIYKSIMDPKYRKDAKEMYEKNRENFTPAETFTESMHRWFPNIKKFQPQNKTLNANLLNSDAKGKRKNRGRKITQKRRKSHKKR